MKGQRSKLHQRLVVQNQETDKLAPVNRHRWWLCHVAIYALHSIVTVQLYIAANSGIIIVQINELWLHNLILEFAATISITQLSVASSMEKRGEPGNEAIQPLKEVYGII